MSSTICVQLMLIAVKKSYHSFYSSLTFHDHEEHLGFGLRCGKKSLLFFQPHFHRHPFVTDRCWTDSLGVSKHLISLIHMVSKSLVCRSYSRVKGHACTEYCMDDIRTLEKHVLPFTASYCIYQAFGPTSPISEHRGCWMMHLIWWPASQ